MNKRQEKLWKQMADLTYDRCKKRCHSLGSCCRDNESYCEMAADMMIKAGLEIPAQKPFLDENGKCLIPPQYRPLCTLHQCDICNLGFAVDDLKWTDEYFKLRAKLALED